MARPKSRFRRWRRHLFRRVRNSVIRWVGPPLLRLWGRTLRVRYLGVRERENGLPRRPVGIFAFWHQRLFALAAIFHHRGFKALVSRHGDGEMLAGLLDGLGIESVRGSTNRGGTQALREILRECKGEIRLAVTPDGPRGPRYSFREGAVYMASRSDLPLYPATVGFAKALQLPTWDGFLIPYPFTRTLVVIDEGIHVPRDAGRAEIEAARRQAEETLRRITETVDKDFAELYARARRARDLDPAEVPSKPDSG